MKIGEVTAKNFLRLIEFAYNFLDLGAVLVTGHNEDDGGSNGSGKSTAAADLLCWILWGETVRGVKGKHVNLGMGDTEGTAQVYLPAGEVRVVREISGGNHILKVFSPDEADPIISGAIGECQKALEQLLGFNKDLFFNCFFIGQGIIKSFSSLTSSQQKAVFEGVLNLGVLNIAQDRAKETHKDLLKEKSTLDIKITGFSDKIAYAGTKLTEAEEWSNKFTLEQAHTIMGLVEQIEQAKQQHQEEVHNHIADLQTLCDVSEQWMYKYIAYFLDVYMLEGLKNNYVNYQNITEEISTRLREALAKVTEVGIEEVKYKTLLAEGKCGVCGSELADSEVPNTLNEVLERKKQARENYSSIELEHAVAAKDEETFRDTYLAPISGAQLESLLTQASSEILVHKRDYDNQVQHFLAEQQKPSKTQHIEVLNQQLALTKETVNPHLESIGTLGKEISEWQGEQKTAAKEAVEIEDKLRYYSFWVDGFGQSGMRSYFLRKITPYLNSRVQYYISRLLPDAVIRFETIKQLANGEMRDNFHVKIEVKHGAESFQASSGGEQQCVNIAVALAMQDLCSASGGQGVGISVMDEVCTNLDTVRAARVAQLLCELTERGTILVISNNEELKPFFQKRITMVKENGITRLAA